MFGMSYRHRHKALKKGPDVSFALMSRPHIIITQFHSVTFKFSKVSESCNKTRGGPKGSQGLPTGLWRGPTWCLRDVNSVSTWLVNPPHTVWLVPVDVGLVGGISMTLVRLKTRFERKSQVKRLAQSSKPYCLNMNTNPPELTLWTRLNLHWVPSMCPRRSSPSGDKPTQSLEQRNYDITNLLQASWFPKNDTTRPVGISSGDVARYSWFSSLKPAPSTTIFKIPTSFRSFPQSCKMWNVQSFIRNYRCFWYNVSVTRSSKLTCRTLITSLAFELWANWAGFWPILFVSISFCLFCLFLFVKANKPVELW